MRRLAEDAIAAKAETVVVIPALPPALAEAVLELVATRLGPVSRPRYAFEWLVYGLASRRAGRRTFAIV